MAGKHVVVELPRTIPRVYCECADRSCYAREDYKCSCGVVACRACIESHLWKLHFKKAENGRK